VLSSGRAPPLSTRLTRQGLNHQVAAMVRRVLWALGVLCYMVHVVDGTILDVSSFVLPGNMTQSLAVQAMVADVAFSWPSLHVALGPPTTYASQTTPQTTLLVEVVNVTGSFVVRNVPLKVRTSFGRLCGSDMLNCQIATMGPITHMYGLSWPPMAAGCTGLASTSSMYVRN
jgi:hypothetical protein